MLAALAGCASATGRPGPPPMPPPAPDSAPGTVLIRWLGCAGFEVRARGETLVLDPYVSRPSASGLLFGHLASDPARVAAALPEASLILIGHSHFEHLLDAPTLSAQTGAPIFGSRTTCFASSALSGGRARCRVVQDNLHFDVGPFSVTAIASRHAETALGGPPLPGELVRPPRWRYPHATELPAGGAWIWVIRVEGLVLVHLSSAALPDDPAALRAVVPQGADVVLASIALREQTPAYARMLVAELAPRLIIPHHHDPLVGPLPVLLAARAREDAERFREEAQPARVEVLEPLEVFELRPERIRALPSAVLIDRAGTAR